MAKSGSISGNIEKVTSKSAEASTIDAFDLIGNKLDPEMVGSIGYKRYEVNAFGKRIREISISQGESGKTFKTTLDLELQKFSTKLLKDKAGSVCVMDIYKGDIVIMASSPIFDPNKFVHGISQKDWKQLTQHRGKPLVNKAMSGLYPPGSTIKTLVTISALENDVVNPKMIQQCKGHIELLRYFGCR